MAGNLINTFDSSTEAAEWIVSLRGRKLSTVRGGINQVCRGEKCQIYDYIWKYLILELK